MDRLDEIAILIAVVETGSLTAAARRLGRSPPAVTRGLAALEERIGLRLIERTTRRLAPTDQAGDLAERGRRLVADYEAALAGAAEGPLKGSLRITAPLVFGRRHVTPIVASFLAQHPGIGVELSLHDGNLDLIEERMHLALRIGRLKDSALLTRRVGAVRQILVASPDYLERRGEPQRPGDLQHHDTVLATGATSIEEWRFETAGRGHSVRIAPRLRVNGIEAALVAVLAGAGIARVLTYQVFDELREGRLIRLLSEFEPPPSPVQIVVPSGRAMAPKVRAFMDHAIAGLEALPQIRET